MVKVKALRQCDVYNARCAIIAMQCTFSTVYSNVSHHCLVHNIKMQFIIKSNTSIHSGIAYATTEFAR